MAIAHYCTIDDVNALVPQVPFAANSRPTADVVRSMIDDIGNEIDATIQSLYITPIISGTFSLQYLRNLNAWGALGRAQESRHTQAVPEAMNLKSVWTRKYEDGLKAIVDPNNLFTLTDAPVNVDRIPKVASQIVTSDVLDGVSDDVELDPLARPNLGMVF